MKGSPRGRAWRERAAPIWYYQGLRRIGATRSGAFIALNPLTAVILGAALILSGIYLCNKALAGAVKKGI